MPGRGRRRRCDAVGRRWRGRRRRCNAIGRRRRGRRRRAVRPGGATRSRCAARWRRWRRSAVATRPVGAGRPRRPRTDCRDLAILSDDIAGAKLPVVEPALHHHRLTPAHQPLCLAPGRDHRAAAIVLDDEAVAIDLGHPALDRDEAALRRQLGDRRAHGRRHLDRRARHLNRARAAGGAQPHQDRRARDHRRAAVLPLVETDHRSAPCLSMHRL